MKGIHIVDNVNNMDDKGGRGRGEDGTGEGSGHGSWESVRRMSMSDARAKLTELVNSAHYSGEPTVVVVNHHDKACVVSNDTLKVAIALQRIGIDLAKYAELSEDIDKFHAALKEHLNHPRDVAR